MKNVTSLTHSSRTLSNPTSGQIKSQVFSNPTSGQIKSQVFCFLNATGQGLLSELTWHRFLCPCCFKVIETTHLCHT